MKKGKENYILYLSNALKPSHLAKHKHALAVSQNTVSKHFKYNMISLIHIKILIPTFLLMQVCY